MKANRIMHEVEQNTIEWLNLRSGKFTSSEIYKLISDPRTKSHLMSSKAFNYCHEKATELLYGRDISTFNGNEHTFRGHEQEILAVVDYETFEQIKTSDGNFWTYGENGSSPDRVVTKDKLLEVKGLSPNEHARALRLVRHSKGLLEYNPKFFYQSQHQMYTTGANSLDFLFYDESLLNIPKEWGHRGYHVTEIEPIHEVFMEFEKRIKLATEVRDYLLMQMIG